jgi:molybdate transport system substrate-binding protein
MYRRALPRLATLVAGALLISGCGASSKNTGAGAGSSAPTLSGTITVFAASSLQATFTELAKQFEAAHPGVTVKLNFGASSALALQINQGAPADVFASASAKNMTQVSEAGGASTSTDFVKNVMEIAVPPSNPAHLNAVADLARPGIKLALCQVQVPCGATAEKVFANAKISVKPVTLEADVKSTLAKVELNEVDAGVVYVTDVLAAGSKVLGIQIPAELNASTAYPIAALTKAGNVAGAQAFVAFVLSATGQSLLTAAGFEKP